MEGIGSVDCWVLFIAKPSATHILVVTAVISPLIPGYQVVHVLVVIQDYQLPSGCLSVSSWYSALVLTWRNNHLPTFSSELQCQWGCQVLIVIWCVHWLCQTRPFQTINILRSTSRAEQDQPITFYSAGLDVKQRNYISLGCLSGPTWHVSLFLTKYPGRPTNCKYEMWWLDWRTGCSYRLHHLITLNGGQSASVTIICLCKPRWLAGLYYYRERYTSHLSHTSWAGPGWTQSE